MPELAPVTSTLLPVSSTMRRILKARSPVCARRLAMPPADASGLRSFIGCPKAQAQIDRPNRDEVVILQRNRRRHSGSSNERPVGAAEIGERDMSSREVDVDVRMPPGNAVHIQENSAAWT